MTTTATSHFDQLQQRRLELPNAPEILWKFPDGKWHWIPVKNYPRRFRLSFSLIQHFMIAASRHTLLFHFRHAAARALVLTEEEGGPPPPPAGPLAPAPRPVGGTDTSASASSPAHIRSALGELSGLDGLTLEVIGTWVWAFDKFEAHSDDLKALGFRFSPKKSRWYLRPAGAKPSSAKGETPIETLRNTYGNTDFSC